jgi:SAM-dependent methyltransferase
MASSIFFRLRRWLKPPHPTWQSKASRNRVVEFLQNEQVRSPEGLRLNVGSASRRFGIKTFNLDLFTGLEVDVQGDLLHLPIEDESVDTVLCAGVLEHVSVPDKAVQEIYRVLKFEGRVFLETPFVAGPASALAWLFQETFATLFSFHNQILYKIGLRLFGWLALPLSWLDMLLERNPMAWHSASGYSLLAVKRQPAERKEEKFVGGS